MRVIWFTNIAMPPVEDRLGYTKSVYGGWLWSLATALRRYTKVSLAIATALPTKKALKFECGGIMFYVQPELAGLWDSKIGGLRHARRSSQLVLDWEADVVHVHGTERFYGMIEPSDIEGRAVVVSIQGLLNACQRYRYSDTTMGDVLRLMTPRHMVRLQDPISQDVLWKRACKREGQIIQKHQHFIGRTDWDRAWLRTLNPNAHYYHCDEVLREVFYQSTWDLPEVDRETLLCTSAMSPSKGVLTLLDATAVLRRWGLGVSLRLAGNWAPNSSYGEIVRHRADSLGILKHIEFLGPLTAAQLADTMKRSHVLVSPSYIENSSNSISEAMLVGLPCVVSFVGGVTTTSRHTETALMFPAGDSMLLADCVRRIITDANTAICLSTQAKRVAGERHNPEKIARNQMAIYQSIACAQD